jgi:hypothetical protein
MFWRESYNPMAAGHANNAELWQSVVRGNIVETTEGHSGLKVGRTQSRHTSLMNNPIIFLNWQRLLALLALATLMGCASHMNVIQDGGDKALMLKGHDPVAYFTEGKHRLGDPAIKLEHEGVTYRFATVENQQKFAKSPAAFVPQYGGFCANGIAYGIPWGGDPDTFRIIDGKLYIFGGTASRNYFSMNDAKNRELADRYWREEIVNANAFIQRYWRLVNRVPHYQTGSELEALWQAHKARQPRS